MTSFTVANYTIPTTYVNDVIKHNEIEVVHITFIGFYIVASGSVNVTFS